MPCRSVYFSKWCVLFFLQALYFCAPFREKLLEYSAKIPKPVPEPDETLLSSLADLFSQVSDLYLAGGGDK